jgi:lysophospholipase L1-like esterase
MITTMKCWQRKQQQENDNNNSEQNVRRCCCVRKGRSIYDVFVMFGIAVILIAIAVVLMKMKLDQHRTTVAHKNNDHTSLRGPTNNDTSTDISTFLPSDEIKVLFVGNSMMSRNDCPGLVKKVIEAAGVPIVSTQVCLRSGATLTSIWNNNQDCIKYQFANKVDYVVMNDQSQGPARQSSRDATIRTIQNYYAPLFNSNDNGNVNSQPPIAIIIQTPAYREEGIQDSDDLGSFDEFTNALAEGVRQYRRAFSSLLSRGARIAPVGEAFRSIRYNDPTMYQKLYLEDGFHLSPHGTWLQSCILFITMFQQRPSSSYDKQWINRSGGELPESDEATKLIQVACDITALC